MMGHNGVMTSPFVSKALQSAQDAIKAQLAMQQAARDAAAANRAGYQAQAPVAPAPVTPAPTTKGGA